MAKPIEPHIRAAAVAEVAAGASVRETARKYGIDDGGLSRIVRADRPDASPSVLTAQKRLDFGVMLADYLEANLHALTVQVRFFSDTAWLAKQDADALAVLHGVIADKSTRLLTALQRRDTTAESGPDTDEGTA